MSVLVEKTDLSLKYTGHYNKVKELLFKNSSEVLNAQRNKAIQDFVLQGIPTRKNEAYKYTNLQPQFFLQGPDDSRWNVVLHHEDILEFPVRQEYDTVILAEVIEHVPAEIGDRMLSKAWEQVGPRGRLIVSVPNEDLVRHRNHLQEFTQADLAGLLGRRYLRV